MTERPFTQSMEPPGGRYGVFSPEPSIEVRFAHFKPVQPAIAQMFIIHGRTEFIEKYYETIRELMARGFEVWTFDWRGQGLSTRELPDRRKGFVRDFDSYLRDLEYIIDHIAENSKDLPRFAIAHSMGGHVLVRYLAMHAHIFQAVVLSAPMIRLNNHPIPEKVAFGFVQTLARLGGGEQFVPGGANFDIMKRPFENNPITSDPDRFQWMKRFITENPRLDLGGATVSWLAAAQKSIDNLWKPGFLELIKTPILLASAQNDSLILNTDHRAFAARVADIKLVTIPGSRHEVMIEKDVIRQWFWVEVDQFLKPYLQASEVQTTTKTLTKTKRKPAK